MEYPYDHSPPPPPPTPPGSLPSSLPSMTHGPTILTNISLCYSTVLSSVRSSSSKSARNEFDNWDAERFEQEAQEAARASAAEAKAPKARKSAKRKSAKSSSDSDSSDEDDSDEYKNWHARHFEQEAARASAAEAKARKSRPKARKSAAISPDSDEDSRLSSEDDSEDKKPMKKTAAMKANKLSQAKKVLGKANGRVSPMKAMKRKVITEEMVEPDHEWWEDPNVNEGKLIKWKTLENLGFLRRGGTNYRKPLPPLGSEDFMYTTGSRYNREIGWGTRWGHDSSSIGGAKGRDRNEGLSV